MQEGGERVMGMRDNPGFGWVVINSVNHPKLRQPGGFASFGLAHAGSRAVPNQMCI